MQSQPLLNPTVKLTFPALLCMPILLAAQEPTRDKRENGELAVSAVTVVDGAYGPQQIATLSAQQGAAYKLCFARATGEASTQRRESMFYGLKPSLHNNCLN